MAQRRYESALLMVGLGVLAVPAQAQGGKTLGFSQDVQPLFQRRCLSCHGAQPRGGLKLDSLENVLRGGAKGPIVVAGKPQESRLLGYVTGTLMPRMPPGGMPLSQAEIATLRNWIAQGAKDGAGSPFTVLPPGAAGTKPAGGAPERPLTLLLPKDGATVKEKVSIRVARDTVPADGFIGIYVDNRFRAAVAPQSQEEMQEKKIPLDAPLTYVWDSQIEQEKSITAREAERFAADGPHVIEVRSYNSDGQIVGTVRANVILRNAVEARQNQAVRLWYGGIPEQQYWIEHTVDLDAAAAAGAFGGAVPTTGTATGGERFTHLESARYLVSLEDLESGTLAGFWRERRETPMALTVNGVKNLIQLDTSSRYYSLDRSGKALRSGAMTREKRFPILNPLELPGRPQRFSEPFNTTLRINLGAYIPGVVELERLQARMEALEWQKGERCARIKVIYQAGTSKVDINSVGIQGADFEVSAGASTIWFSETTQRVLKATHDVTGTLVLDTSAAEFGGGAGGFGGAGGLGGEMGPGMAGGPGMMGGGPGMMAGGPGMMGGSGGGFGAPFGGGGPGMMAGGPGMMAGSGGGAGMMAGGPGMMAGGPGMMGGGPGMMGGGFGFGQPPSQSELAGLAQRKRRFHIKLKVSTEVVPAKPQPKR